MNTNISLATHLSQIKSKGDALNKLLSQSGVAEKWLSENRESLANQAADVVASHHSLNNSAKSELYEKVNDYLYLIQRALHWGGTTLMKRYFREYQNISLSLSPAYYKEALRLIIDEKTPHYLSTEETMIAKEYFDALIKNITTD